MTSVVQGMAFEIREFQPRLGPSCFFRLDIIKVMYLFLFSIRQISLHLIFKKISSPVSIKHKLATTLRYALKHYVFTGWFTEAFDLNCC